MPRLFVANLTFESELADDRQDVPQRLQRLCAELVPLWLAAADEGDWLWCPEGIADAFWDQLHRQGLPLVQRCGPSAAAPPGLVLSPWGWSRQAGEFGARAGAVMDAPCHSAVREVNARLFSFRLEQEERCGPPWAAAVTSIVDLESALRSCRPDERWVLKSRFSAAGRERLTGSGPQPSDQALNWIRHRLAGGEPLIVEPWLDRIDEAGLQWDVPRSGAPRLIGVTPLLCDAAGRYRGSGFGTDAATLAQWQDAVEVSRRAAARVQQAGYFGPLGIDAMRYRDAEGEVRLRPLQDINARWTMGRIALGWRRIVADGVWRHGSPGECADASAHRAIIPTSPESVGGEPVRHCTWIEPQSPLAGRAPLAGRG